LGSTFGRKAIGGVGWRAGFKIGAKNPGGKKLCKELYRNGLGLGIADLSVGDATSMSQGRNGFDVDAEDEADVDVAVGEAHDDDFSDLMVVANSSSKYFMAS